MNRAYLTPIWFLFLLSPAALAQQADDDTALELRLLTEQLIVSVLAGNDVAVVDEITCLDDFLRAQLRREEALGLIADAADPDLVASRKASARSEVERFVRRLTARGAAIEAVDVSRVEIFDSLEGNGESVIGDREEELRITAAGVLGLRTPAGQRPVDVEVRRLGERWCLDPLSMQ